MGKWTNEDTSKASGDSTSKAAAAGHQAREDATKAGLFERGNSEKNSRSFSRTDESGERATGFLGINFWFQKIMLEIQQG